MLDVAILGTLEVRRDGQRVDLPGARQRALLVTLALQAPAVVAADHLIEVLWGAQPPKDPSNRLQWQVAGLRRMLGPDAIVTRAPGYALGTTRERIDACRFEQQLDDAHSLAATDPHRARRVLRDALRLWRGPPLVDLPDDPGFAAEARRLDERRLVALEESLALALDVGDAGAAVADAESLVREHPYRERLHALRMRALYAAGRQAEALSAFQEAREVLDAELGIEPGPELRELERAILRQDPALAPDARGTDERPTPRPATGAPGPPLPSILVVAADADELAEPLAIAAALAASSHRHALVLARLLDQDGADRLAAATGELAARRDELGAAGVAARVAVFTTARWSDDVVRLADDARVDLALLPLPEPGRRTAQRLPAPVAEVLAAAPCDVALVAPRATTEGGGAGDVLVAFGGGDHDWASLEIAAWLAAAEGRPLRVAGTAGDDASGRRDASRLLAIASLAVQELVGVVAEPVIVDATAEAVLGASANSHLLVLPFPDTWQADGLGRFRAAVVRDASTRVLLVRSGRRPGGLTPPDGLTRYSWSSPAPPGRL